MGENHNKIPFLVQFNNPKTRIHTKSELAVVFVDLARKIKRQWWGSATGKTEQQGGARKHKQERKGERTSDFSYACMSVCMCGVGEVTNEENVVVFSLFI